MTISKVFGKCMLLTIFAAATLCLIAGMIFAQGGAEPPMPANTVPDGPPYFGNVEVEYCEFCCGTEVDDDPLIILYACCTEEEYDEAVIGGIGCAILYGDVVRAGNIGHVIKLDGTLYEANVKLEEQFQQHTQQDIRGRDIFGPFIGRGDLGIYTIIGAHSLVYNEDMTRFWVDMIIMPLRSK